MNTGYGIDCSVSPLIGRWVLHLGSKGIVQALSVVDGDFWLLVLSDGRLYEWAARNVEVVPFDELREFDMPIPGGGV